MKLLEKYRWSSFLDYVGIKNFPLVTSRKFLLSFFGGEHDYRQQTIEWLSDRVNNQKDIAGILLE